MRPSRSLLFHFTLIAALPIIVQAGTTIRPELLFAQPNASAPPPTTERPGTAISDLLSRATKRAISIIVGFKLDEEWQPEAKLTTAKAKMQRELVETECANIGSRYADKKVSVRCLSPLPFASFTADLDFLQRLNIDSRVASIELNDTGRIALRESIPLINAPSAWNAGFIGTDWAVAVLDTGVDKTHPFFGNRVIAEGCFSNLDPNYSSNGVCPNGQPTMSGPGAGVNCAPFIAGCSHGTNVAGVAAGSSDQDAIWGVAKGASIIAIQIFHRVNDATPCGVPPCVLFNTDDLVAGLNYVGTLADTYKIAAVNMSVSYAGSANQHNIRTSCTFAYPSIKTAVNNLRAKNIAVVGASGNDGVLIGINGPACIPGVIAVGATTKDDTVASFSNTSTELDLLAPGAGNAAHFGILSSVPHGDPDYPYLPYNGTSQAAPHVAGAIAVLRQKSPLAAPDTLLADLVNTGVPINDQRRPGLVLPRINLGAALVADQSAPSAPSSLVATGSSSSVSLQWTAATDEHGIARYSIQRRTSIGGAFGEVATTSLTTYTDTLVAASSMYQYRVQAFDTSNNASPTSNVDAATTFVYAHEPAVASSTPIRATDVTDLRATIAIMRSFAGLATATWTDASLGGVELTRFRGQLRMCGGVHDGKAEAISG